VLNFNNDHKNYWDTAGNNYNVVEFIKHDELESIGRLGI